MVSYLLFFIALSIGGIYGDSAVKVTVDRADITMNENPFFDSWTVSLASSKDIISLKASIKLDLPASVKVKLETRMGDDKITEEIMSLCQVFEDVDLKEIFDIGKPEDKFLKQCPIKAGYEFVVEYYLFQYEEVSVDSFEGPTRGKLSIFQDGKDPFIIIILEGNVTK